MPLVTHVGAGTNARYSQARRRRPPADRIRRVHLAPGGLVADLRRRVRTAPGPEARDHRDTGQLVPRHRRRARRRLVVLRRQARRAAEPGAARAGAAPTERVHGRERVLRRQLRLALRGRAGRRCTASTPSCCGARTTRTSRARSSTRRAGDMPSVTRLALRNTFCDVPPAETLRMVGQNAIDVYDLDARRPPRPSPTRSAHRPSRSWPRRSTRCPRVPASRPSAPVPAAGAEPLLTGAGRTAGGRQTPHPVSRTGAVMTAAAGGLLRGQRRARPCNPRGRESGLITANIAIAIGWPSRPPPAAGGRVREGTEAWIDAATEFGRVHDDLTSADAPDPSAETVHVRAWTEFGDVLIARSSVPNRQGGT